MYTLTVSGMLHSDSSQYLSSSGLADSLTAPDDFDLLKYASDESSDVKLESNQNLDCLIDQVCYIWNTGNTV